MHGKYPVVHVRSSGLGKQLLWTKLARNPACGTASEIFFMKTPIAVWNVTIGTDTGPVGSPAVGLTKLALCN